VAHNFQTGNNKIKLYLLPQLEDHQSDMAFQQDGVPPHGARIVRELLDMHFPECWVGRDGQIPWSPRPPDITPLDFFLWAYVKDIVYKTPVTSLDKLKLRIIATIGTVTPQCCITLGGKFNSAWASYVP
jgi:hypothetical protein